MKRAWFMLLPQLGKLALGAGAGAGVGGNFEYGREKWVMIVDSRSGSIGNKQWAYPVHKMPEWLQVNVIKRFEVENELVLYKPFFLKYKHNFDGLVMEDDVNVMQAQKPKFLKWLVDAQIPENLYSVEKYKDMDCIGAFLLTIT
jgi:hypothetical protein